MDPLRGCRITVLHFTVYKVPQSKVTRSPLNSCKRQVSFLLGSLFMIASKAMFLGSLFKTTGPLQENDPASSPSLYLPPSLGLPSPSCVLSCSKACPCMLLGSCPKGHLFCGFTHKCHCPVKLLQAQLPGKERRIKTPELKDIRLQK